MSKTRLDQMADVLGREREGVSHLRRVVGWNSANREVAERLLQLKLVSEGYRPEDLPPFSVAHELPAGTLGFGRLWDGQRLGPEFAFSLGDFEGHAGFFGASKAGKSLAAIHLIKQAIQEGCHVWAFSFTFEYLPLIRHFGPDVLLVLPYDRVQINMLKPPGRTPPLIWAGQLKKILRDTCYMRDGSCNMLGEELAALYSKFGVLNGGNTYPCLSDLLEALDRRRYAATQRHAGFLETLQDRLGNIRGFLPSFDTRESFDPELMLSRSIVYLLAGLTETLLDVFLSFMCVWVETFRMGTL